MKPVRVELSADDCERARACAARRVRDAVAVGAKDRLHSDSEDSHYWGALGEVAAAKFLGATWACASMVWAVADVGTYEVRSIPPGHRVYLKAKDNDPADRRILLVAHIDGPAALVLGWMTASDIREFGKREDWGGRGAPAYMLTSLAMLQEP